MKYCGQHLPPSALEHWVKNNLVISLPNFTKINLLRLFRSKNFFFFIERLGSTFIVILNKTNIRFLFYRCWLAVYFFNCITSSICMMLKTFVAMFLMKNHFLMHKMYGCVCVWRLNERRKTKRQTYFLCMYLQFFWTMHFNVHFELLWYDTFVWYFMLCYTSGS